MRICSLLSSGTEIIYALGLGNQLVAVSHECDYPEDVRSKPAVTRSRINSHHLASREIDDMVSRHIKTGEPIYEIDIEALQRARPDIILTQELCDVCAVNHTDTEKAVKKLDYSPTIISLSPQSIEDLFKDIHRVGDLTGRNHEADKLVTHLKVRIEKVSEITRRIVARRSTACLEWLDPPMNAGHWVPEMVEVAGGVDGLARKGNPSARIVWQQVIDFDPEVMILMPCGFTLERTLREAKILGQNLDLRKVRAVADRQVYAVDGHSYFSRSGPRLINGIEILAQILHPEKFSFPVFEKAVTKTSF